MYKIAFVYKIFTGIDKNCKNLEIVNYYYYHYLFFLNFYIITIIINIPCWG